MKNKNTLLITAFLIAVFSIESYTQEVVFTYDNSGNRKTRTIEWDENTNDTTNTQTDTTLFKTGQIPKETPQTHTAKIGEQTVHIFPNPNTGMFNISIDGWQNNTKAEINLYTLSGTAIIEKTLKQAETKIKFGNQPDGTYILTVTIDGKKETWKVVKK
ncbi:MAG: hypothetical protein B6D61_04795 [Bacteroidetes bacterium 4484_249]|nr:MAG: hypothetical protein B6D61_04795 [Bacteroidetes bacterium 4484_249]